MGTQAIVDIRVIVGIRGIRDIRDGLVSQAIVDIRVIAGIRGIRDGLDIRG